MAIIFFCFGFLMVGVEGCGSQHDNATANNSKDSLISFKDSSSQNKDTTLHLVIDGKIKTIVTGKYGAIEMLEIAKVADMFKGRRIDTFVTRFLDITGDGVPEKIVGHLYLSHDTVWETREIFEKNKLIYSDANFDYLCDTSEENEASGIEASLCPLEPYSTIREFLRYIVDP